ncbi:hypothetical protein CGCF415_v004874 [Colletotrichum fructicola]|uniref:Uncharacterized protein n=3 Tax=Colletotrichum gloeosporioides species complex TaxID=2707338 RepID=L2FG83_COLFN|nr:uncharacterized protein CGMCC3_g12009 [Colletotrichum fructicola]XP_036492734.1 uncharacterized protein CGCS363_v009985 [Colletotrichum siamense]XP_053036091.1 uncharacterized protein COL26b_007231 [Colletotrichum chrysophilum]KAF4477751.1 hypothetical protein CGGC5_v013214 [Colletotrichum fructicola Nara gc5]KAI8196210.1 hypothetical protein KHU50_010349 [Colletotrichum sp. SAR 10_65]KAI8230748.1 hypothetical protein K4K55_006487 [Colletotrichum sp. SAR 10_96]KAI8287052.1 hypothetical pro
MQLTKFLFTLLAAGVMGQRCSETLTYCSGSACLCFADGVAEELNKICKAKGFERSLGPSKTTVGTAERCDHQCCTG